MPEAMHPGRTLLRVLGKRGQISIALVATTTLLERLLVVGATLAFTLDHPVAAIVVAVALAAIFLIRSTARSLLRIEILSQLLMATSDAVLNDRIELGGQSPAEGELALVDGLYACETTLGDHLPEVIGDAPACACVLAIALVALPLRLVVLGGIATVVGAGALLMARRVSNKSADRVWEAFGSLLEGFTTIVRARIELVAAGEGRAALGKLTDRAQEWKARSKRAAFTSFLAGRAPAVAVGLVVGAVLVLDEGMRGNLANGVLARAAILASMTPAFSGLGRAWLEMGKFGARVRPIVDLLNRDKGSGDIRKSLIEPNGAIMMDHVTFGYGPHEVVRDLSLTFKVGEVTALTGPNGCGKSTLLALALGLAKPTVGTISWAGVDVSNVDWASLRRRAGYLSQKPFLPDGATVGEALRLLAPHADEETIRTLLEQVQLWRALEAHDPRAPLDVRVGSLSAGEKQRLAIARVLARRASFLFLDEPDANLDAEGLEVVASLLRELAPGRVVVVAAHSPRLAAAADRVVSLANAASVPLHGGEGLFQIDSRRVHNVDS